MAVVLKTDSRSVAMPTQIFNKIPVPKRMLNVPLAMDSSWHTWSADARCILSALGGALANIEPPRLVHLKKGDGYDYTFTVAHTGLLESPVGRDVAALAAVLVELSPPKEIIFFAGLLDEHISGHILHFLFALMRDAIAEQAGSPWAALYAPLAKIGKDVGDFLFIATCIVHKFSGTSSRTFRRMAAGRLFFYKLPKC